MATFTVTTDNPTEAQLILDALNKGSQVYRPTDRESDARATGPSEVPAQPVAEDDPWADEPAQQRQESRQAARTTGSPKTGIPRSGTHQVSTPKGDRYWTFGLPNAPQCDCGLTAAHMAPSERPPFDWAKWTCPLRFSKDTYKGACDFSDWAPKK